MMPIRVTHPLIKMINGSLVDLPTPSNISYMWNFGSLLGGCLALQLVTGLFLAMHYSCDVSLAFESVSHIVRDVNYGWALRTMHANGASFFFIFLYLHVARGIYYGSYKFTLTWMVGVAILLAVQATAFLGYVLPWGQMSFWGATVITNLVSSVPLVGEEIVIWLWGGFSVDNATLTRFFAFHFLLPFIVSAMVAIHFLFLHESGSNNPLGLQGHTDKVPFHPYFSEKDVFGAMFAGAVVVSVVLLSPNLFGDPENFLPANALVTPVHIQPEWYFLFAYAILRAIPNKLGGVVALVASILILGILPLLPPANFKSLAFYPLGKIAFWGFIGTFLLLTYAGAKPVEAPYVVLSQSLSVIYFMYFLAFGLMNKLWDALMSKA